MQESFAEITLAELPLVIFNLARSQGDYYQATRGGGHGDYRHVVLAPVDITETVELTQLAFHLADRWRNPVLVYGDYLTADVQESVAIEPIDFGPVPEKRWAVDGSGTGSGHAAAPLPARARQQPAPSRSGSRPTCGAIAAREARRDPAAGGTRRDRVPRRRGDGRRRLRQPGPVRAGRHRGAARGGERIGFVRPITLWPFPSDVVASAAAGPGPWRRSSLCAGQMIDDVRLAVLGAAPVVGIGGISTDGSGFGVGRLLDVERVRDRIAAVHRGGPDAVPPLPDNERTLW